MFKLYKNKFRLKTNPIYCINQGAQLIKFHYNRIQQDIRYFASGDT